jgi:hypothetical protein
MMPPYSPTARYVGNVTNRSVNPPVLPAKSPPPLIGL